MNTINTLTEKEIERDIFHMQNLQNESLFLGLGGQAQCPTTTGSLLQNGLLIFDQLKSSNFAASTGLLTRSYKMSSSHARFQAFPFCMLPALSFCSPEPPAQQSILQNAWLGLPPGISTGIPRVYIKICYIYIYICI